MNAFWHADQLLHSPVHFIQRGYLRPAFEIPARADALLTEVREMGMAIQQPGPIGRDDLFGVHSEAYVRFIETAYADWAATPDCGPEVLPSIHPWTEVTTCQGRPGASIVGRAGWYMADAACAISAHTWTSALAAAATALHAADEVSAGRHAYALTRPPGHHAFRERAGGHCFFNNAALAAGRLRAAGAARVAILDIDSHHGNGTQSVFWHRGDVMCVSVHGDPDHYYPWYLGRADERGAGEGEGRNLNIPLAIGSGDDVWVQAITHGLGQIAQFQADALIVSLGFDASKDEPLNALCVTEDGFARAGRRCATAGIPTLIVQEGGYNVAMLGPLLARFLGGFGG